MVVLPLCRRWTAACWHRDLETYNFFSHHDAIMQEVDSSMLAQVSMRLRGSMSRAGNPVDFILLSLVLSNASIIQWM